MLFLIYTHVQHEETRKTKIVGRCEYLQAKLETGITTLTRLIHQATGELVEIWGFVVEIKGTIVIE